MALPRDALELYLEDLGQLTIMPARTEPLHVALITQLPRHSSRSGSPASCGRKRSPSNRAAATLRIPVAFDHLFWPHLITGSGSIRSPILGT